MYHLRDHLDVVKGIGPKLAMTFEEAGFVTVKDLIMHLPFRYEDRSVRFTIDQIKQLAINKEKKLFTLEAVVNSSRSAYVRGRSLQSATISDETGKITASWFNNPFIVKRLKTGESYLFSGAASISKKGQIFLTQPVVEDLDKESIHTDRLVPIYSSVPGILPTVLRKFQKEILDHLEKFADPLSSLTRSRTSVNRDRRSASQHDLNLNLTLSHALKAIHFPDEMEHTILARERFALEELILLIQHSHALKEEWKKGKKTITIKSGKVVIPKTIPFELTSSQVRSAEEICQDLTESHPMNRLLIGDVGSGKTIVAGLAMQKIVDAGFHAALVAPTQILAEQHSKTLAKFFPEIPIFTVTGKSKPEYYKPGFIIGTHAVLNAIAAKGSSRPAKANLKMTISTPVGLIVFDEQHRFGVSQRSELAHLGIHPHLLTMTATPIPRSYMLTIFSHLSLSTIDELPKNRIPTKTWVLPEGKRASMYDWIKEQTRENPQFLTLIVCPFINPSESQALENVAAVKEMYEKIRTHFSHREKNSSVNLRDEGDTISIALLHSKLKKVEKDVIMKNLFAAKTNILVTTPIIEVGVDLPQASAIIIEAAERFGLASLHQLRGRVGRAGQQGYCLLFTSERKDSPAVGGAGSPKQKMTNRLKEFEKISSGQKLAEIDLQNRGAGDLFGTQQHGFDELQFATWSDVKLIYLAKTVAEQWQKHHSKSDHPLGEKQYTSPLLQVRKKETVLAN